MIHGAKERLVDAGATLVRTHQDYTGVWGYRLNISGHKFILVAKQFTYKDNASFMVEAVERAGVVGSWLLFYNGESDSYTVFDAEYVTENGKDSHGMSRTREADWLEVPMTAGVGLLQFIQRSKRPSTVDDTRPTGLGRYS